MKKKSARRQAISDMCKELHDEGKILIQFRKSLNPIMRILVNQHIRSQKEIQSIKRKVMNYIPTKANSQLVAHCFFSKATGKSELSNYTKYYSKEK